MTILKTTVGFCSSRAFWLYHKPMVILQGENLFLQFQFQFLLVSMIRSTVMTKILKLPPRKLEPQYVPRSFFLLRLLCIFINLPYAHVWNTVVTSGMVPLVAT